MSSDESAVEEDETEIIINHKLPWISDVMEDFKQLLDAESLQCKSHQALQQTKTRKTGYPSSRQEPTDKSMYPSWVFNWLARL